MIYGKSKRNLKKLKIDPIVFQPKKLPDVYRPENNFNLDALIPPLLSDETSLHSTSTTSTLPSSAKTERRKFFSLTFFVVRL